ncbi:hypothetical protein [Bacillus benzoevorans]|uniref:Uncharacterized protein n=1 Tax=Bacillus benzoevorans TaxID=1456 RepID=A0A7X0HTD8_9BACI|nr:hypothetical protein [Bacillus benzoevorans]MBB6446463.1 hypothetical protein [Bacillus benzoevorans]
MYVDSAYYHDTYNGVPIEDADLFARLGSRAADLINQLTKYAIHGDNLTKFHSIVQENVKKAVCAQIEYMLQNGGETSIHGGSPASVSVGNFSYQGGAGNEIVSPAAISHLRSVGLLYSGLSVL